MTRGMFRGILCIGLALIFIGILMQGTVGVVLDITAIVLVSAAYFIYRKTYNKQP